MLLDHGDAIHARSRGRIDVLAVCPASAADKQQTTAKPCGRKPSAPCSTLSNRLSAELNLALVTGCCLAPLAVFSRTGASASGTVSTRATDAAAACRGTALLHTSLEGVLALPGWLIAQGLLCRARRLERDQRQLTIGCKLGRNTVP